MPDGVCVEGGEGRGLVASGVGGCVHTRGGPGGASDQPAEKRAFQFPQLS